MGVHVKYSEEWQPSGSRLGVPEVWIVQRVWRSKQNKEDLGETRTPRVIFVRTTTAVLEVGLGYCGINTPPDTRHSEQTGEKRGGSLIVEIGEGLREEDRTVKKRVEN